MENQTQKIFDHNLNPSVLILNGVIEIKREDNSRIRFKSPTISDMMENPDYMLIVALLAAEEGYYKKMQLPFSVDTRASYLYGLTTYKENNPYSIVLLSFFERYIENLTSSNYILKTNDIIIHGSELEFIADVILISTGYKSLESIQSSEKDEEKEFAGLADFEVKLLKKEKAAQEKLRKAKEKKSKKDKNESLTLEYIIATVCYEFRISLEDIKKLNYYTLYWYFSHAVKIDYHKVMQIAAGTGNLGKKNKYAHWAL